MNTLNWELKRLIRFKELISTIKSYVEFYEEIRLRSYSVEDIYDIEWSTLVDYFLEQGEFVERNIKNLVDVIEDKFDTEKMLQTCSVNEYDKGVMERRTKENAW